MGAALAEPLLTRRELAAMLRVTVQATYHMALPPMIRLSRRTHRWRKADVEQFLRQRTEEA